MIDVKKMVKPALMTGVVMGVVGAIPVLSCLNLFCCLLVLAAGGGAAYLLKKSEKNLEIVDGAVVGALSGVAYAIVATVFGTVITVVLTAIFGAATLPFNMMGGGYQNPMMGALGGVGLQGAATVLAAVFQLVVGLIVYPIFAAIGGIIYVKLSERNKVSPVATSTKKAA